MARWSQKVTGGDLVKFPFIGKTTKDLAPGGDVPGQDTVSDRVGAKDLPIALYLNQRLTFDLLASLEGGFSSFATIHTTSSEDKSLEVSGGAQLGSSNAFGLFGVELGGRGTRQSGRNQSASTTESIVHTPSSLFARLRKELSDRQLVRHVTSPDDLSGIRPGEFVEFEATLRKSPLIEMLDSFAGLIPLMALAGVEPSQTLPANVDKKSNKGQRKNQESPRLEDQLDLVRSALTAGSSQDLIAEMHSMRIVLTAETEYLIDPSMNDTIDGTFTVFGKATRIITADSQGISLLRKTALGRFDNIASGFTEALGGITETGFSGSMETHITGPTMQVIPIAIFS